ncbi:hypothetical protein N9B90_00115 [bacterium]|nr:hypothetical protein [bacterium]
MSYSATLIDGKDGMNIDVSVDRYIVWGHMRVFSQSGIYAQTTV